MATSTVELVLACNGGCGYKLPADHLAARVGAVRVGSDCPQCVTSTVGLYRVELVLERER